MIKTLVFIAAALAAALPSLAEQTALDEGYRAMYNLDFGTAHRIFKDWQVSHPQDGMGPASDAAAYLFAEFDRLRILQSEFFADDNSFLSSRKLSADPAVKVQFEKALQRTDEVVAATLAKSPNDLNAQLAKLLRLGLHSDYLALVEKKNLAALSEVKESRTLAEKMLREHPECYDAWLAVGVENYLLSLKPAPVRWLLRIGGAQTDKDTGIAKLRITAEKGRYLLPYARLLLAVAAVRDKRHADARQILTWLSTEYPKNRLYREELEKLH
ncbi:MAG: hypothetical protein ABI693_08530 [Bryobacteraceae bacterium]